MNFGERIANERKRLGYSQATFAKLVGVSLSSQKRYELGLRTPDIVYSEALQKLGVDVVYALKGGYSEPERDDKQLIKAIATTFSVSMQEIESVFEKSLVNSANEGYDPLIFFEEMVKVSSVFQLTADKYSEFDVSLLTSILEGLEISIAKNDLKITPSKKAQACIMLYRAFKPSKKIDQVRIDDTVKLAAN